METAIIFGGVSSEHDASISSASNVIGRLDERVTLAKTVYISRGGHWHIDSAPRSRPEEELLRLPVVTPAQAIGELGCCWTFNLLHGQEGEDGTAAGFGRFARLAGSWGTPLGDALGMAKWAGGSVAEQALAGAVRAPRTAVVRSPREAAELAAPWLDGDLIIKPGGSGASIRTFAVNGWSPDRYRSLIEEILCLGSVCLIQERVRGAEYSVGVVEVEGRARALPVVRLVSAGGFYGHDQKHRSGGVTKVFEDDETTRRLQKHAEQLMVSLEGFGWARMDFLVPGNGPDVFLETNTLPGLMSGSIFPKMLTHAGLGITDLVLLLQAADTRRRANAPDVRFHYEIDEEQVS